MTLIALSDSMCAHAPEPSDLAVESILLVNMGLGAALGVINARHTVNQSRRTLRVVPVRAVPGRCVNPRLALCIEVTNLSAFAVTR